MAEKLFDKQGCDNVRRGEPRNKAAGLGRPLPGMPQRCGGKAVILKLFSPKDSLTENKKAKTGIMDEKTKKQLNKIRRPAAKIPLMPTKSACKILVVCYNQNNPNTEQGQRGPQCKSCGPRSDSGDKSIKRTKEILLLHKGVRHPLDGGAARFLFGQEISERRKQNEH